MTYTQVQLPYLLSQPSPRFPSPLLERLSITSPFSHLTTPFLRRDQVKIHASAPLAVDSVKFRNKICDWQPGVAGYVARLLCFWESDKTQWLALYLSCVLIQSC